MIRRQNLFLLIALNFIFLFTNPATANCDFSTVENSQALQKLSSIELIHVKIHESRKWIKNSLKAFVSNQRYLLPKYKKKFRATVIVSYSFGSCTFPAKVRINGDWKDHLELLPSGHPFNSLDVKLKQGNVAGIVAFKLLLPRTRNYAKEPLTTHLLTSLGYLAPLTGFVNVKQNGASGRMLFQEKARKELLERAHRRESLILEGDESLLWGYDNRKPFSTERVSLSRLKNAPWVLRGNSSMKMASAAIERLQNAYMEYTESKRMTTFDYSLLTSNQSASDFMKTYDLLLMALRADHAMRSHNRQFYWNPYESSFEPIYYDGNVNPYRPNLIFINDEEFEWIVGKIDVRQITALIQSLKQIDMTEYRSKLKSAGLASERIQKAPDFVEKVISNLTDLEPEFHQIKSAAPNAKHSFFTENKNRRLSYNSRLFRTYTNSKSIRIRSIDADKRTAETQICNMNTCSDEILTWDELSMIWGRELIDKEPLTIYTGQTDDASQILPIKTTRLKGDIKIQHSKTSDVRFYEKTNSIEMISNNSSDWFLIKNASLGATKFSWRSNGDRKQSQPENGTSQRFNEFGLTGCLNFYNVTFHGTSIDSSGANCEDAINLVKSSGELDSVSVKNAQSDALDMDFSNIKINKLFVRNAGNDCGDFSAGNYRLESASLENCRDKGLSVGEKSVLTGDLVKISNSAVGIASKDSSKTTIGMLRAKNLTKCGDVYKKKQEFDGASLNILSTNCDPNLFTRDNDSIIINNSRK